MFKKESFMHIMEMYFRNLNYSSKLKNENIMYYIIYYKLINWIVVGF